jgi:RNA polymerase subunit RPABC4/transcription elongation factor Spt4
MATCPNCHTSLDDKAKFCPECGRAVGTWPQEFRIVTVVFCDVVRSTDLESQLGPLPMQRLLDRYGQAVRRALGDPGPDPGGIVRDATSLVRGCTGTPRIRL